MLFPREVMPGVRFASVMLTRRDGAMDITPIYRAMLSRLGVSQFEFSTYRMAISNPMLTPSDCW